MNLSVTLRIIPLTYAKGVFGILDTTGTYHLADNPEGYGIPNIKREDLYYRFSATRIYYREAAFPQEVLNISMMEGYEGKVEAHAGGLIRLYLYASSIYSPMVATYQVGQVCWHTGEQAYVRIQDVSAPATYVSIPLSALQESDYLFTKEYTYFYALELEKYLSELLLQLPAHSLQDIYDWEKSYETARKDSEILHLFVCNHYSNSALMLLASYQKPTQQSLCA